MWYCSIFFIHLPLQKLVIVKKMKKLYKITRSIALLVPFFGFRRQECSGAGSTTLFSGSADLRWNTVKNRKIILKGK
jgi:hypothetical protein